MASSIIKTKVQHTVIETAPKATLLMSLAGLFILFVSALLIQNLESPMKLSRVIALFSVYSGVFIGGLYCGNRLNGGSATGASIASSVVVLLLLILAKILIPATTSASGSIYICVMHLLIPIFALLGALVGSRIRVQKETRKRKKYYRSKR